MKKVNILFIIGMILILIGMTVQLEYLIRDNEERQTIINNQKKEIKEHQKEIKELEAKVLEIAKEKTKVEAENQYLWSNYYMNVSNYEGYEYYE